MCVCCPRLLRKLTLGAYFSVISNIFRPSNKRYPRMASNGVDRAWNPHPSHQSPCFVPSRYNRSSTHRIRSPQATDARTSTSHIGATDGRRQKTGQNLRNSVGETEIDIFYGLLLRPAPKCKMTVSIHVTNARNML